MRVVFASYNPGKLREVRNLGQAAGIEVTSLKETGRDIEFQETGHTFEENARLKLEQTVAAAPDLKDWVAADDSGMMIDALNGEPGVKTRRWIGREMTDQEILEMTLARLAGVPRPERTAHLRTVVALGKTGLEPVLFNGDLDGIILEEPHQGTPDIPGFPAAKLFYIPDIDMTYGQYVSKPETAGDFPSHRAKAFAKAFEYLSAI